MTCPLNASKYATQFFFSVLSAWDGNKILQIATHHRARTAECPVYICTQDTKHVDCMQEARMYKNLTKLCSYNIYFQTFGGLKMVNMTITKHLCLHLYYVIPLVLPAPP